MSSSRSKPSSRSSTARSVHLSRARSEQAPGEVEEVDVVALAELAGHARHQPPGAKQGQVEGEPVVGRQPGRQAELGVEGGEEGRLVTRLGEEELDQLDPVGMRPRDGGGEDLGAGPAGEAGGLGVEEGEIVDVEPAQLGTGLGPIEPADGKHLGPAPGNAIVVLKRLEAARWNAARRFEAGGRGGGPAGKRT